MLLALAITGCLAAAEPSHDQALVYYNARAALRERQPKQVLELWLLHNTLANRSGEGGEHEADFRSLVWAALGELGLCQDGFPDDLDGAGLWPLALFNWIVRSMAKGPPPTQQAPFDAFEVGLQRRFVSLSDVLSAEELRTVSFSRGECWLARATALRRTGKLLRDLRDRPQVAELLRSILELSRSTLKSSTVKNAAAIEARIFDLNLVLANYAARAARRDAGTAGRRAKSLGVSTAGAAQLVERREAIARAHDTRQARILRASLGWSAEDWLALSRERRLFLFGQARRLTHDEAALERLVLSIVDALAARGEGEELEAWIAFLERGEASEALVRRRAVFAGERGSKLLALGGDTGFRERAVIALHRGIAFLEAGEVSEALRSFAFALHHAEQSREAVKVAALSRRWLSYVLSRHETDEHVIATLAAIVPRHEYNAVVEDLVWRAALTADRRSFLSSTSSGKGSASAFDDRVARLRPLAEGRLGDFGARVRSGLHDEPHLTMRFLRKLVERLEAEEREVRAAHLPTLDLLVRALAPLTASERQSERRVAEELIGRMHGMREGLGAAPPAEDLEAGARGLAPRSETFAGSVRVAPIDPVPWPFATPETSPPSAFSPIALTPVEWRDDEGKWVFGWRIGE